MGFKCDDLGKEHFQALSLLKKSEHMQQGVDHQGCCSGTGLKAWFEDDDSGLQSCDTSQQHSTEGCPAAPPLQHSSQLFCDENISDYSQHSVHGHPSAEDFNECR